MYFFYTKFIRDFEIYIFYFLRAVSDTFFDFELKKRGSFNDILQVFI